MYRSLLCLALASFGAIALDAPTLMAPPEKDAWLDESLATRWIQQDPALTHGVPYAQPAQQRFENDSQMLRYRYLWHHSAVEISLGDKHVLPGEKENILLFNFQHRF
ncbi:hypothetical protein [Gallaecimonas pentaromativorans]|uniref:Uncharacterized protein n=1 Tax=Gallaecimonas pentaromativorans TaxID=584787 RepID=A0A3N1P8P1_9GAMM|nr:hypothetical protein [Gallaecimonas pentaromativorans]MED5523816.1 hypothetical protein [Pseudomonadota bacterium]ROQ27722.1 hypothetical protein EDC28_104381 [Gallaecimonas pentaromativorans]